MSYYGSEFADRVVAAYFRHCKRFGIQYDEPGRLGPEILRIAAGREVVEIKNRWGGVAFRACETRTGRVRRLKTADE